MSRASRSIPFARPLLLALVSAAVALAIVLVVAAVIAGPHLAHAMASFVQVHSLGVHPYPTDPCPTGAPTC